MTIQEKVDRALQYEQTVHEWRRDYNSEEWRFCSALNIELYGKPFNRSINCECIDDFFLLLNFQNKQKRFKVMSEKKFHLKPGIVIQGQDFPNGVTSASSDQECILLLSKNKKNAKHFEKLPSDWEKIVDSFDPKKASKDSEEGLDLDSMKVEDLKAFAKANGIELTKSKKAEIIEEISSAIQAKEDSEESKEEPSEEETAANSEEDSEE